MKASCQIVSSSCSLRVIIAAIGHFSPHEDITSEQEVARLSQKGSTTAQCRRAAIVLQCDDIEMGPRCRRRQPNLSSTSVSHVSFR